MQTEPVARTLLAVPCHNEERRLRWEYFVTLHERIHGLCLVFVDDGSLDGTLGILRDISNDIPRSSVLSISRNVGKANAVRQGMLSAWGQVTTPFLVGYLDCDGAFDPAHVGRIVNSSHTIASRSSGPLVVFPNRRFTDRAPQLRRVASRAVREVIALGTSSPDLRDWQAGFKLYRANEDLHQALLQPFRSRWFPDVELLARLPQDTTILQPEFAGVIDVRGTTLRARAALDIIIDLAKVKTLQWSQRRQS